MANNFPVMPDMQLAELQYAVEIGPISGATATFPAGSLHLVNVAFETDVVDGVIQFDYTRFDQDTHEATMTQMLNGLCSVMAQGPLGVGLDEVRSAITIRRTWIYAGTDPGADAGYQFTDQMPYP